MIDEIFGWDFLEKNLATEYKMWEKLRFSKSDEEFRYK